MEAKDLRIGNYIERSIKIEQDKKIIDKVGCQDIVRIFENIGGFNYEPIPLTEQWLLDFGFEISYSSNFRLRFDYNKNTKFGFDYSHTADKSIEGFRYIGTYIKCDYVHQLQNLYFALTNEELTLNK
jgi:hypothetical protein